MSIVGPLVTPNKLETRFDGSTIRPRVFRHPVLTTICALAIAAGTAIATHTIPSPF